MYSFWKMHVDSPVQTHRYLGSDDVLVLQKMNFMINKYFPIRNVDPLLFFFFPSPGETRRILSVNPTYDWTCFSYALLNVSPMQVESSPPLPCPPPCHSLHNCSLCLSSNGSDGGWQHCVWSMALQRVRLSSSSYDHVTISQL